MRAHGFSLVEVLVAVCVLAVGALGALSTQALARSTGTSAILQARALSLADALAAHISAEGGAHYLGVDYDAASGAPAAPATLCTSSSCSPGEFAQEVLFRAKVSLHTRFPGGRLVICRDGSIVTPDGLLAWDCVDDANAPVAIKIGWAGAANPMLVRLVGAAP